MFTNIKNRFISVIAPDMPPLPSPADHQLQRASTGGGGPSHHYNRHHPHHSQHRGSATQNRQDKFQYARPPFLQLLTIDELRASADHNVRPIIVARDISLLPWGTGYAECVNSGKSEWNEDQAAFCRQVLSDPTHKHPDLPYTYFGIFDGHAGYGAALAASHLFHHILHEKLVDCIELLLPRDDELAATQTTTNGFPHPAHFHRRVNKDELISGALESAFFHMDSLIAQDRDRYCDAGGCTSCVALFINGKMYVANAGDSRAVLCQRKATKPTDDAKIKSDIEENPEDESALGTYFVPFSFDHTPETERHRLLTVALLKPHLLGKQYIAMEYARRPHVKDLGQRILCRQGTMKGWAYKTLTREDLRMPVVTGEGKRSRLLGTLGVTRGFGDHDLLAITTGTQIKPFLTPHPDVTIRDLAKIVSIPDESNEDGDYGVLVMATDGLWDVSENEVVARTTFQTLAKYPTEKHRYTMVAQELVARARGKINDSGHWRLADSKAAATVDDISVIVIPVYQYYKEHVEWERKCVEEHQRRVQEKKLQQATEAKEVEQMVATALVNGVARVDIENDEDEEDIVVELNRPKAEASVEVEEPQKPVKLQEDKAQSEQVLLLSAAESEATSGSLPSGTAAKDDNEGAQELTDAQLNAAIAELELSNSTLDLKDESATLTPLKSSKSKQQTHQHHRNRKDKR